MPSLGVFDALSARIAWKAGVPSIYITGYGAAASHLGVPDIGLMSMSEMVDHVRRIADAVDCPVIADADTGYGGPANVRRTVREYEAAGVDLIQLEDQEWPKRCGHMEGKRLVSAGEMVQRIRVAVDARRNPDCLIMARTDAIAVEGFEPAMERALAYKDAGADVLFVEAPRGEEEMAGIPAKVGLPCLANMVEGGKTPFHDITELRRMGYAIALYPVSTLFASALAVQKIAAAMVEKGTSRPVWNDMMSFAEFNNVIGLHEFEALMENPCSLKKDGEQETEKT